MEEFKIALERVKELVLEKAVIRFDSTGDGNIKLGIIGSWMELAGNCEWYIPELDIWLKGTCGKFCKGCFDPQNPRCSKCYVFKSITRKTNRNADGTVGDIIMNPCTVKLGHAYRTIAMLYFRKELLKSLDGQLSRRYKNGKIDTIRINESGEFTCFEDLELWCELAARHPEDTFYVYTKNYNAVRKAIREDIIPQNLFINISIWHECGIKQYLEFKNHPQIRAFALVDEEWTIDKYKKKGIEITTMCGAYDSKGKMNHNVTCDKCKKCFSHLNKCTGCFEH